MLGNGSRQLCLLRSQDQLSHLFRSASLHCQGNLFPLGNKFVCSFLTDNLDQGHKKYGNRPLDNPHIFYLRFARPVGNFDSIQLLNRDKLKILLKLIEEKIFDIFYLIFLYSCIIFVIAYYLIRFRQ